MDCHWDAKEFKWCPKKGPEENPTHTCSFAHNIWLEKMLGKGQFGSVYAVSYTPEETDRDQTNAENTQGRSTACVWDSKKKRSFTDGAAKIFDLATDSSAHENFVNEVHMLSKLGSHPNTLQLLSAKISPPVYVLVTEKMSGNLFSLLYEPSKLKESSLLFVPDHAYYSDFRSNFQNLVSVVSQLHEGLKHTHDSGIIHRDIKR